MHIRKCGVSLFLATLCWLPHLRADLHEQPARVSPRFITMDLNAGETAEASLPDGETVSVRLLTVEDRRDAIRNAMRRSRVRVSINGEEATLDTGLYALPRVVGGVRVDCTVTRGYYLNSGDDRWRLDKDARLRFWPEHGPLTQPDTFAYPIRQRWHGSLTWFDNEPVDGGSEVSDTIYYHAGIDIGGVEGRTEILAAADALVVSARGETLDAHVDDTPVVPRYDVVYLLDGRGWYYRYSHFHTIDSAITPGARVSMGARLGLLGKEGASGGWAHMHFEIKCRQPNGDWGTLAAHALIREAYQREYKPAMIACARQRHLHLPGDVVTLESGHCWSAAAPIVSHEWLFTDGSGASGERVERVYERAGRFSEILKITDGLGNSTYDFAEVQVLNPLDAARYTPSLHAAYYPTLNLKPNDAITFSVRAFRFSDGEEVWDFGDGSPKVTTRSGADKNPLAPEGYAFIEHRYTAPGDYIVRVYREDEDGTPAYTHLLVSIE